MYSTTTIVLLDIHECSNLGLSLKRASAVLYRTTFPTEKKKKKKKLEKNFEKKKKKKKKPNHCMLVSVKGLPLKNVLFTIWTGNAIKMGKMTRSLKKKRKKKGLFGEALFLTTSPPCGFVN